MSQKEDLVGGNESGADGEEDTKGVKPIADEADDSDAEVIAALQKDPDGIKKLLAYKRGKNAEDKGFRLEAEKYKKELDQLKDNQKKAEEEAARAQMTEQEKLDQDLKKLREEGAEYQSQLTKAQQEKLVLKAENVALRLGYNGDNPDFIEFMLNKHINSLTDADKSSFGDEQLANWVASFKESNPNQFGSQKQEPKPAGRTRPPINSGNKPPEKQSNELPDRLKDPKTPKDFADLDKHIKSKIRS